MSEKTQIRAVGVEPSVADLLAGSYLYSTCAEVLEVSRFVELDDFDEPAKTVVASIVALARRKVPPSPQLVLDELKRCGKLTRSHGVWLASAATSGACSTAARHYAAAVVAQSFRRQTESSGTALIAASSAASEVEVAALAETALARIRNIADRLTELRGDAE